MIHPMRREVSEAAEINHPSEALLFALAVGGAHVIRLGEILHF